MTLKLKPIPEIEIHKGFTLIGSPPPVYPEPVYELSETGPHISPTGPIYIDVWTCTDGRLYIPNPIDKNRVTVYPNLEGYNNRTEIPYSMDRILVPEPVQLFNINTFTLSVISSHHE